MRKYLYLIVMIVSAVLAACGDDDNPVVVNENSILGSWKLVKVEGWEDDPSNSYVYKADESEQFTLTFNTDGTCQYCSKDSTKTRDREFKYTYYGSNLLIEEDGYEVEQMTCTVLGDTMSLEIEGEGYYEKMFFTRVTDVSNQNTDDSKSKSDDELPRFWRH